MAYIITATFDPTAEPNAGCRIDALLRAPGVRVLEDRRTGSDEHEPRVVVDVRGDFARKGELTVTLCTTLTQHGVVEFAIRHSW